MRYILALAALICLLPGLALAECSNCPGGGAEAKCACGQWHEYRGGGELSGLRIIFDAQSAQSGSEGLMLLLRDPARRKLQDFALQGPHAGRKELDFIFTTPTPGAALKLGVLTNYSSQPVAMSYLMIEGIFKDGATHVYFEKSCPGVVIGAQGCQRMVLFEDTPPAP
jgi:hypothetical protein